MKRSFITPILCFLLTLTSCVPSESIEKLALVSASGYDIDSEGKTLLSMQIIKATEEASGVSSNIIGGERVSSDVVVYTTKGNNPSDVFNKTTTKLGKMLFSAHNRVSIFGDAYARKGVKDVIDLYLRQYQIRPNLPLLVSKTSASEIIRGYTSEEKIPAAAIENLMDIQKLYGFSPVVTVLDFANALASKTAAPILGVIEYIGDESTSSGDIFKLAGTAVFKKDKLIGYLDENETRGMQFVRSKIKAGEIKITHENHGEVFLSILKSGSKVKAKIKEGTLSIDVITEVQSDLVMAQGSMDPFKTPEIMEELAVLQNEAVKKEIELALYAAQDKYNADIFDFGSEVHKRYPKQWKDMESNWKSIFPAIDVNIIVKSTIERPGEISKPMY